jgi:hypothetical protein
MAIDLYGIDEERYITLFKRNARLMFKTINALHAAASKEGLNLNVWPYDIIWKMYESMCYDTNEEARLIQKEENPEAFKSGAYDPVVYPSHYEMMETLKEIKAQLAPHVE